MRGLRNLSAIYALTAIAPAMLSRNLHENSAPTHAPAQNKRYISKKPNSKIAKLRKNTNRHKRKICAKRANRRGAYS